MLEREELYRRIDERVERMVAAGAGEEVRRADAAGASRTARSALGFEELLRGDVETMQRRTRSYAKRQLTWMRKLAGAHLIDLTGRTAEDAAAEVERARPGIECRAVRFEKWQALGNDYAIVEESELPFPLTPERVRAALRASHRHRNGRRAAALGDRRARLRGRGADLQPRRVRGRAVGQRRARGGALPAPQRTGSTTTPSPCAPRPGRSARASPARTPARWTWDGCACARSATTPRGGEDGTGTIEAGGREFRFQFVQVGNPQCAIEVEEGIEELDLPRYGAPVERDERFPRRTNVSFWQRTGEREIRARIFERGVGETMSSGTGATGAAVAAVLRGMDSPVTVRLDGGDLEVEVGEDMHVDLTGWARPVYRGELSDELMEELRATE